MNSLYSTLIEVLKQKTDFFSESGELLRNAVYEAAMKMDPSLIKLLADNETTKKRFFTDVDGVLVFDKVGFGWVINNKEFLPDSYTRFKNKIGLVDESGSFISTSDKVELVFPYKDCVLEGGQTKEDQKRAEIFYNETLAPDEVDRLLYPKVLSNATRYTSNGNEKITEFSDNNLIIKGNNLLALASILRKFENKIQCICIDPPYNTENCGFEYNDTFNHSTWLTFMKTRLELSKKLLSINGTIFIFCDDREQAYLRVLLDNIWGREYYIQTIVWKNCDNSNNDAKQFSQDHNYILVYSKNAKWESLKLDRTEDQVSHYKNPDNDPRGPWFDGNPVNSPNPRKNLMYDIVSPSGKIIKHPPNGWRWEKDELSRRIASGEIRFNSNETSIIRRTYLYEQKGLPPSTLWDIQSDFIWNDIDITGHTRQAKYEQKKLFPEKLTSELFRTPKPERVIKKILDISTKEGDIVLDFFGGSGTSAAVAHKMKRKYILFEQMNYIDTYVISRLLKVIHGEKGGISDLVNWQGGGSFVYCELAKLNQNYVDKIESATTDAELVALLAEIIDTDFISCKVNPAYIKENAKSFEELTVDDKKRFLMELLDKNQLYVNYCDIDDENYHISEEDKAFTKSFYGDK